MSRRDLLPVEAGDLPRLRAALERALTGGSPIIPYAAALPPLPAHDPAALPADLAVVVGTSGSTGPPKLALLTADALVAGAEATHAALGGPGRWLLAVQPAHIAGLQVLVRARLAGAPAAVVDRRDGFTPAAFVAAATELAGRAGPARRYTALVPTQVARLLDNPAGTAALAGFDAVLAGGAALAPQLRERAAEAGVRLIATYGMSETAGGCVYDGWPLPGTQVVLEADGRIRLAGPSLAAGYLGRPAETAAAFVADGATRWFRTDDLGEHLPDGRLRVLGRRDDVIVTGGLKVHPRVVEEAALTRLPGVAQAVAVGVPDPQWGQAVVLAVVRAPAAGPLPDATTAWARDLLRGELAAYALPQRVLVLDGLPERGPGKPDRAAVAAHAARSGVGQ